MGIKKTACFLLAAFLILLVAFTTGELAAEDCLNPQDRATFMQMYNDVLSQAQGGGIDNAPDQVLQKVENIKAFLKTHGCAGELLDAEKVAPGIVKSLGETPGLK